MSPPASAVNRRLRVFDDGAAVFDPVTWQTHLLSPDGLALLDELDGIAAEGARGPAAMIAQLLRDDASGAGQAAPPVPDLIPRLQGLAELAWHRRVRAPGQGQASRRPSRPDPGPAPAFRPVGDPAAPGGAAPNAGPRRTLGAEDAAHRLQGDGLVLDLGAMRVRVRSPLAELPEPLARVYRALPPPEEPGFVDCEVELLPTAGPRRVWRPGVRFLADGTEPFEPMPAGLALPQLEWGLNWVFAHLFTRHWLLHAGTLDWHGAGLLLVAAPGSGKSTLTAALSLAGARLLSDEFGVLRLSDRRLLPITKPVALKNAAIALIARRSPQAVLGPVFHKTHKGDVAHLAVPAEAAARRHESVAPAVVVFPTWRAGARAELTEVRPARAIAEFAANSFNYGVLGEAGFEAACALAADAGCWRLTFGELDDALALLEPLCRARGQRRV
ncbi:MAG: HprK-related kinase A [Betaproteobacteria bacterium]|nr:HprK-related kinase A [Betaproteobacteria bacterium]